MHLTFLGMRETFWGLVTVRQETTAKSNRPEFKKESELTSPFAEVTQDHRKF